jgi:uncharacterized MAPEG superfamily protein
VIGYVRSRGPLKAADYVVAPTTVLPAWVNRANRAHINAVESLAPFAIIVLVAKACSVSTTVTVYAAMTFFFARVAHALVHLTGSLGSVRGRTLLFTIGWAAFVAFAVELLRNA